MTFITTINKITSAHSLNSALECYTSL